VGVEIRGKVFDDDGVVHEDLFVPGRLAGVGGWRQRPDVTRYLSKDLGFDVRPFEKWGRYAVDGY